MNLQVEEKTFIDEDGIAHIYYVFFVEIKGIKIYLKANDKTAKQLLVNYVQELKASK